LVDNDILGCQLLDNDAGFCRAKGQETAAPSFVGHDQRGGVHISRAARREERALDFAHMSQHALYRPPFFAHPLLRRIEAMQARGGERRAHEATSVTCKLNCGILGLECRKACVPSRVARARAEARGTVQEADAFAGGYKYAMAGEVENAIGD